MILTILFVILSAWYDSGKKFENHIPRFVFRFAVVVLISIVDGNFLYSFVINTALFYLLFDFTLNIMERRKWNYVGTTAYIDKAWQKIGGWKPKTIFKLIFLTISIRLKWIIKYLKNGLFGS